MKYPVSADKWYEQVKQEIGFQPDETLKSIFSLFIDAVNQAYKDGCAAENSKHIKENVT